MGPRRLARTSSTVSIAPRDKYKKMPQRPRSTKQSKTDQDAKELATTLGLRRKGLQTAQPALSSSAASGSSSSQRVTRGLQYAYSNTHAPRKVVPRPPPAKSGPLPLLPGQEDISISSSSSDDEPDSEIHWDQESDLNQGFEQGSPIDAARESESDSDSQASTVIEEDSYEAFGFGAWMHGEAPSYHNGSQSLRRMGAVYLDHPPPFQNPIAYPLTYNGEASNTEVPSFTESQAPPFGRTSSVLPAQYVVDPTASPGSRFDAMNPGVQRSSVTGTNYWTFGGADGATAFDEAPFAFPGSQLPSVIPGDTLCDLPADEIQQLLNHMPAFDPDAPGELDADAPGELDADAPGELDPDVGGESIGGSMDVNIAWRPELLRVSPPMGDTRVGFPHPGVDFLMSPLLAPRQSRLTFSRSRSFTPTPGSPQIRQVSTPLPINCPPPGASQRSFDCTIGCSTRDQPMFGSPASVQSTPNPSSRTSSPAPGHAQLAPLPTLRPSPLATLSAQAGLADTVPEPSQMPYSEDLPDHTPEVPMSSSTTSTLENELDQRSARLGSPSSSAGLIASHSAACSPMPQRFHFARLGCPPAPPVIHPAAPVQVTHIATTNGPGCATTSSLEGPHGAPNARMSAGPSTPRPLGQLTHLKAGYLKAVVPTIRDLQADKQAYYKKFRRNVRIAPPKLNAPPKKRGGTRVGDLPENTQIYMKVADHSIFFDVLHLSPWTEDREDILERAIAHAETVLPWKWVNISPAEDDSNETLQARIQRLRGYLAPHGSTVAETYFKNAASTVDEARDYATSHAFLYPDSRKRPEDFFFIPAVGEVIQGLLFDADRQVGVVYMRELLADDEPNEVSRLCASIGVLDPDAVPTLADPSATRGIPIAMIALAGVLLNHGIIRMHMSKAAKKKCYFSETNYGQTWATYVHALIQHPKLGDLRTNMFSNVPDMGSQLAAAQRGRLRSRRQLAALFSTHLDTVHGLLAHLASNNSLVSERKLGFADVSDVLEIFQEPTDRFSQAEVPLIHEVLPELLTLRARLYDIRDNLLNQGLHHVTRVAAEAALLVFDKYMGAMEVSDVYSLSVVMCPDRKLKWFADRGFDVKMIRDRAIARFNAMFPSQASQPGDDDVALVTRGSIWTQRHSSSARSPPQLDRDTIDAYLDSSVVPEDVIAQYGGILPYWEAQLQRRPRVAQMALYYLSAPATSVDAERAFSGGRLMINHLQHRTSVRSFQAQMAIGSWYETPLLPNLSDIARIIGDHM